MAQFPHKPQLRANRPTVPPLPQQWAVGTLGPKSGVIATTISARLWVCGPWTCPATAIATSLAVDPGTNSGRLVLLGLYQSTGNLPAGAALVAQAATTTAAKPQVLPFAAQAVHGSTYWLAFVNTTGNYANLPAVPTPGVAVWFAAAATLPPTLPAVADLNPNTALALQIALTLP